MSDKNLLCIVLTFGLAFFTIGNAFRAGNFVLGWETLFIWLIVYSIMPLAMIIDKKLIYEKAPVDLNVLLFKTVQNGYLFISFCISLRLRVYIYIISYLTTKRLKNEKFLQINLNFTVGLFCITAERLR